MLGIWTSKRHKKPHSLSVRLTLIFLLTGILLLVLAIGAFRFSAEEHIQTRWRDMLVDYVAIITQGINPPFTEAQTQSLAERTNTQVSILSDQGYWIPQQPPFSLEDPHWRTTPDADLKISRWHGYFILTRQITGGTIIFYDRPIKGFNFLTPGSMISLGLIVLVVFGSFHYVKKLLRPIKTLTSAAEHIRDGNLEVNVPARSRDELGVLTMTFNSMSQQIKHMLDAKHQLLIALSHELRSPLTRLRIAGELLPKSATRESIISDCRIMESLIADIMEGERLGANSLHLRFETIQIPKLIDETCKDFPTNQQSLIQIIGGPGVSVVGDPIRLKILLRNLIQNALDYGNALPVTVQWTLNSEQVEISVIDQGPGFDDSDLQHIGEPLFRADKVRRHHQGNGMGLYLCTLICRAHNGRLRVQNRPLSHQERSPQEGQEITGAEITIELPIASPEI
ncbi:sensor histidine kinase [Hahella ganghwensis]|uniref:sensor histidine kinase n=1 Tax=Hahella ganghwensis TaxID=286420 RepID=UPI00037C8477|nr:HAMP domain-containing sensor histidine kinase [Hahella ganghwensis]